MINQGKNLGPNEIAAIAMTVEEYMSGGHDKAIRDREEVTRLVVEFYLAGMTDRATILSALERSRI